MTKCILLTGGAGYIGSHTYAALSDAGYRIVVLDNFCNSDRSVVPRLEQITEKPVTVIEADVCDGTALDAVFSEHDIDAVVHFAALKAVGESTEKPLEYMACNIGGLVTLMQAMQRADVFKLVFSSSASVYGEPETLPVAEDAALGHSSPYGYTKFACEQIIEQASQADSRWHVGVLRYFNPVGAHSSGLIGEDPNGVPANLVPYLADVAVGKRPEISVFGDDYPTPDGTGVRDYIHVSDLARGHVLSLDALFRDGQGHTVNLGTGHGYSVLEMIHAYSKACGKDLPYRIAPRRPGDPAASYADPTKARALLGFEAQHDVDDMCATSWKWVSGKEL